jgi:Kae1-associated kinase Bud32
VNELLFRGAEAEIRAEAFLGHDCVAKRRVAKTYRHPELDARLRRERTRLEAALLSEARAAGVPVPIVLDVDLASATLRMDRIGGRRLRDAIEAAPERAARWSRGFGELVGRLHAAGLVHGDLTTSNVHLLESERLVLLDFGLAQRSEELEDRGVDLHLVERAFDSSHPGALELHGAFLEGYRRRFPGAELVERRVAEIKSRARYA